MRPSSEDVHRFMLTKICIYGTSTYQPRIAIGRIFHAQVAWNFVAVDGMFICNYCMMKEVDEVVPATLVEDPANEQLQWRIVGVQRPDPGNCCAHCGADLSPAAASTSTSSGS